MIIRFVAKAVLLAMVLGAAPVSAQTDPQPAAPPLSVFGWEVPQDERLKISGEFIAAWSHDGAQAQLGLEKQGRIAEATITISGRITDRVRYLVSFNPVNEVSS
jgi:hypothetical protein